jgi:hypothetical protein
LRIYLLLAGVIAISFLVLLFSDYNVKYEIPGTSISQDFREMIKLLKRPLVIVFCSFRFYVCNDRTGHHELDTHF